MTAGSGGSGWDSDLAQISMENCGHNASDSALESSPLAKLISIKFLGLGGYLEGRSGRYYSALSGSAVSGRGDGI